jgi:hypothetical protein
MASADTSLREWSRSTLRWRTGRAAMASSSAAARWELSCAQSHRAEGPCSSLATVVASSTHVSSSADASAGLRHGATERRGFVEVALEGFELGPLELSQGEAFDPFIHV